MALTADDRAELGELVEDYADCVDGFRLDELVGLFCEDGVLRTPRGERRGREAIGSAMALLERYARTFHQLGQTRFRAGGTDDEAIGLVLCTAHHVTAHPEGGATDHTLHIRYHDRYRRDGGRWRFAVRDLEQVFASESPVVEH